MGCRKPLTNNDVAKCFPRFPLKHVTIQSISIAVDMKRSINLINLSRQIPPRHCFFEAELFPALRLTREFLPLCVNVFASGKVIILGIRSLSQVSKFSRRIQNYINMYDIVKISQ
jgi:TATA-box binding protein (TBP) (component of TFIID and TFIIIB)